MDESLHLARAKNPDAFVVCVGTPVLTESPSGASIWSDAEKSGGLTVCVNGESLLVGIYNSSGTALVAKVTTDDAVWFGRKMTDLANQ